MDSNSLSAGAYVLFIVPGFVAVWVFRHFTNTKEKLGEFEYLLWSSIYGFLLLFFILIPGAYGKHIPISIATNSPLVFLSSLLGVSFAESSIAAPIVGYVFAALANKGLFRWVDKMLRTLLSKISK